MFSMCGAKVPEMLQLHTTISEAISEKYGGTISCTPIGVEPIKYVWADAWQKKINLELDESNSEARNVPPGDYHINVTDAIGREACVKIRVKQCPLPVIIGYQTENSTTDISRDGKVTAIIIPKLENIRYLWTNGAITDEPTLLDIKCGVYGVILISKEDEAPILFVNASKPAIVKVG